jgi:hypothetical protein
MKTIEVEVEVKLRPTVSRPVRLRVSHPSGTRDQFFFLLEISFRQLRVCYYVALSLTRGRVCNLLLLLVLASSVPLGSESRGTQDRILRVFSQFLRHPQPERPGPRIYIPSGTGFPFRRLLRPAGLRWRYSIPPPHGKMKIIFLCYRIFTESGTWCWRTNHNWWVQTISFNLFWTHNALNKVLNFQGRNNQFLNERSYNFLIKVVLLSFFLAFF